MSAGPYSLNVGFRDFGTGERFCIDWQPPERIVGALLVIPPFGEEMNKTRRAMASAARLFAANGWHVRLIDAFGTGDSPGDFGAATWTLWREDYRAAAADLAHASGATVSFWGVRAGGLMAHEIASPKAILLLWQPMQSGEQQLMQLLRMRVAQESFSGAGSPTSTKSLRAILESGTALEIGGYDLNPSLVLPMSERSLEASAAEAGRILWLETSTEAKFAPAPASARTIAALRGRGVEVAYEHVIGEPFWATVEIQDAPTLAQRSLELLATVAAC